jgi:predicted metal-binding membrane protein
VIRRLSCCPPPGGSFGSVKFYLFTTIALVVSLAATFNFCLSMAGGMDMPGGWRMSMMWMPMPGQGWLASAGMFLSMWLSMMVAMMLPSVASKLLLFYRSLVWKRASDPGLSTAAVAFGYFIVWTAVGAGVYGLGLPWALAAMRWPGLSRQVPLLTGLLLAGAGAYQFGSWKKEGLSRCRNLLVYGIAPKRKRRPGKRGEPVPEIMEEVDFKASLFEGFRQGLSCAVCCAGSMVVLVALGAMNLYVMLAVAVVIAFEKLLPNPKPVVYSTGSFAIVVGIVLVIRCLF